jgi:hypothetical protein
MQNWADPGRCTVVCNLRCWVLSDMTQCRLVRGYRRLRGAWRVNIKGYRKGMITVEMEGEIRHLPLGLRWCWTEDVPVLLSPPPLGVVGGVGGPCALLGDPDAWLCGDGLSPLRLVSSCLHLLLWIIWRHCVRYCRMYISTLSYFTTLYQLCAA